MRVSKFIHSCVLLEEGDTKILLDPGKFSFLPDSGVTTDQFEKITAILITHQHPDHVDAEAVERIVRRNPQAVVLANREVVDLLSKAGVAAEVFEEGSRPCGECTLEGIPAAHAELLNSPRPRNVAYLVDGLFLHPGDSFDHALDGRKGIAMLALPVSAPWTTELGVAEFARRMEPKKILPIHDGYVKDFFLTGRYENYGRHFKELGIEFLTPKKPGDGYEVT